MTSQISWLAYHKPARSFPKSSVPLHSVNKRARNNYSVTRRTLPCWLFVSLLLKILRILKYANWNILLSNEVSWNSQKIGTKHWKNQKRIKLNIPIRPDGTLDDHLCSAILWSAILDRSHYQKSQKWLSWIHDKRWRNWPQLNLEVTITPW